MINRTFLLVLAAALLLGVPAWLYYGQAIAMANPAWLCMGW